MNDKKNQEDSNLDNYTKNKVKDGIANLIEEKELKIKWRNELESNPAVVDYFKSYYGNAMQGFLDNYLNTKYLYYTYGEKYKEILERKRDNWINEAHKQLEYILQKKLFDIQCLWRAEQIVIDGVKISYDFKMWENDILNCQFLEPITKADIEMYQAFLTNSDLNPNNLDSFEWQDYDEIKTCYNSNNDDEDYFMPEWYEYHNTRTGNSSLLILSDIRGEKENFYIQLHHDTENKKEAQDKVFPVIEIDKRPFLSSFDKETIKFFVNTFEDNESQKKYKYYAEGVKNYDDFDFQFILDSILDSDDFIPVESHYDIKQAISIAYNKYYLGKIAEHLPMAHEQYLFNKKMGFKFETEKENFYLRLRDDMIRLILKGRVLNGEENNLNF
jgi:hypothetical protein